jgi:hypothetical protein
LTVPAAELMNVSVFHELSASLAFFLTHGFEQHLEFFVAHVVTS